MNSKYFAIFFVLCMLSTDFMIPVVLAGHHGNRGGHGLELLLAAGILAKILRKKGHHHHHHHGRHGGSSHGHGPHGHGPPHGHGEQSGTRNVEVVHVAPPMGGYSSYYPGGPSYGGAQAATTSFSASIEYPFSAQSAPHGMHHPYGGPASAASFIGYEPQPVQYMQSMPMPEAGHMPGGPPPSFQP